MRLSANNLWIHFNMLDSQKWILDLYFEIIKTNSIFSAYHAEYFKYYTSPKFYPVQLTPVFSISVENSVDPERNQWIWI